MSCTLLLFTANAIVRTVPSANRPNWRKKKTDDILLSTLIRVLPKNVQQHVQLTMKEDSTYAEVREQVRWLPTSAFHVHRPETKFCKTLVPRLLVQ